MSSEQVAALEQFKQLVQHSPFDIRIAVLGVGAVSGLAALHMAFQRAPAPEHRDKWQLEHLRRDLWSKYFRGRWYLP
jgi:ribosomal protein S9